MSNTPKISIPITKDETVSSSSSQPRVTRPMWSPESGAARQQEIQKARQEAWEQHQRKIEETKQLVMRVSYLEAVVSVLQTEMKELKANATKA